MEQTLMQRQQLYEIHDDLRLHGFELTDVRWCQCSYVFWVRHKRLNRRRARIISGGCPVFCADYYLLHIRDHNLWAQRNGSRRGLSLSLEDPMLREQLLQLLGE